MAGYKFILSLFFTKTLLGEIALFFNKPVLVSEDISVCPSQWFVCKQQLLECWTGKAMFRGAGEQQPVFSSGVNACGSDDACADYDSPAATRVILQRDIAVVMVSHRHHVLRA